MKILITGGTGFIGQALCRRWRADGHDLILLPRNWSHIEQADAVVHLAGEPIANERWTQDKRRRILESRILGSRRLVEALEKLPPSVFVSASAIGYYGDRSDEILDENSSAGSGFLADVCQKWEAETIGRALPSTRQITMRFGLVLGHGGALQKMLPIFKAGFGGTLGGGEQWMSWIHIYDLIAMIDFAGKNKFVSGIVNAVSPNPVTNKHFSQALAHAVGTRAWLAAPTFALKALLGQRAELLLDSQRVLPKRMTQLGFQFQYPNIESAINSLRKAQN